MAGCGAWSGGQVALRQNPANVPCRRAALLARTLEVRALGAGHGARFSIDYSGLLLVGGRLSFGERRGTAERHRSSRRSSGSDLYCVELPAAARVLCLLRGPTKGGTALVMETVRHGNHACDTLIQSS